MSSILSVSEARAALPQILDRVSAGEEIVLTRHGEPVAVVVRPDTLRVRRADKALAKAGAIREMLAAARAEPIPDKPGITRRRADELVAEVHAARAAR